MLCERATVQIIDDLEQDIFIKIWKSLNTFNSQSKIQTWIYRISANTIIDYIRKSKFTVCSDIENMEIEEPTSEDKKLEHRNQVNYLLSELDELHRVVIILFYLEEKSIAEISNILEIKEGTIKSRLHIAKKKAKEILITDREDNHE